MRSMSPRAIEPLHTSHPYPSIPHQQSHHHTLPHLLPSTETMPTSADSESSNSSHAVTRPNPDIVGVNEDRSVTSSARLFRHASKAWTIDAWKAERVPTNKNIGPESRQVLFQSFEGMDKNNVSLVPYRHGLVEVIIRAFQRDLHLTLRPDDVWLAIMVQFGFYVNGRAELLKK